MMKNVMKVMGTAVLLLLMVQGVYALIAPDKQEARPLRGVSLENARYAEIQFTNRAQQIPLGGMLFVPEGDGPFPAAVLIHGSGPSRRDNGWYLTLADHLQRSGIVVLLPDKRGSVQSGGDWRTASLTDLATDTAAAIEYLQTQQRVAVAQIGIIGLSQGGHFAPLAARMAPETAFVVNMVGAAVPMRTQLVYEENHNLRELGVLPGLSNLLAYPAAWSIRTVRQRTFWNAVDGYDPRPDWQALRVPALALYGAEDRNVNGAQSAAILERVNPAQIDVRVYAGSGHALEDPPGVGDRLIRAEALDAIVDFILAATTPAAS